MKWKLLLHTKFIHLNRNHFAILKSTYILSLCLSTPLKMSHIQIEKGTDKKREKKCVIWDRHAFLHEWWRKFLTNLLFIVKLILHTTLNTMTKRFVGKKLTLRESRNKKFVNVNWQFYVKINFHVMPCRILISIKSLKFIILFLLYVKDFLITSRHFIVFEAILIFCVNFYRDCLFSKPCIKWASISNFEIKFSWEKFKRFFHSK